MFRYTIEKAETGPVGLPWYWRATVDGVQIARGWCRSKNTARKHVERCRHQVTKPNALRRIWNQGVKG